ncbi:uncharacterized protein HD556DRAFT_1312283 [Suillus plorans]|uniref:Uncharacterized protein n=1 Tax=Suillus plorans TaxID=116603 RepID=A0A9P7AGQ8_9AGAM|nr:uncharacterized protein HD556DRAFT_1312283 [Suillus plorans]KAG1787994.1 hypothetical protein HD556DRAFT_1312283 [Suillus plorans]
MEKMHETRDSDEKMTNNGEDDDNLEDEEDAEEEGSGSDEDSEEECHKDKNNKEDVNQDPHTTEYLINDDITDEIDEFGYTSLDQVLVEDEDDDALGAEDGEEDHSAVRDTRKSWQCLARSVGGSRVFCNMASEVSNTVWESSQELPGLSDSGWFC